MEKGQERLDFARLAQSLESFSRRSSEHSCLVNEPKAVFDGPAQREAQRFAAEALGEAGASDE
jgi:hypothetical protein